MSTETSWRRASRESCSVCSNKPVCVTDFNSLVTAHSRRRPHGATSNEALPGFKWRDERRWETKGSQSGLWSALQNRRPTKLDEPSTQSTSVLQLSTQRKRTDLFAPNVVRYCFPDVSDFFPPFAAGDKIIQIGEGGGKKYIFVVSTLQHSLQRLHPLQLAKQTTSISANLLFFMPETAEWWQDDG